MTDDSKPEAVVGTPPEIPPEPQGFKLDSIENLARAAQHLRGAIAVLDAYHAALAERVRTIELRLGIKPNKRIIH